MGIFPGQVSGIDFGAAMETQSSCSVSQLHTFCFPRAVVLLLIYIVEISIHICVKKGLSHYNNKKRLKTLLLSPEQLLDGSHKEANPKVIC